MAIRIDDFNDPRTTQQKLDSLFHAAVQVPGGPLALAYALHMEDHPGVWREVYLQQGLLLAPGYNGTNIVVYTPRAHNVAAGLCRELAPGQDLKVVLHAATQVTDEFARGARVSVYERLRHITQRNAGDAYGAPDIVDYTVLPLLLLKPAYALELLQLPMDTLRAMDAMDDALATTALGMSMAVPAEEMMGRAKSIQRRAVEARREHRGGHTIAWDCSRVT